MSNMLASSQISGLLGRVQVSRQGERDEGRGDQDKGFTTRPSYQAGREPYYGNYPVREYAQVIRTPKKICSRGCVDSFISFIPWYHGIYLDSSVVFANHQEARTRHCLCCNIAVLGSPAHKWKKTALVARILSRLAEDHSVNYMFNLSICFIIPESSCNRHVSCWAVFLNGHVMGTEDQYTALKKADHSAEAESLCRRWLAFSQLHVPMSMALLL